MSQLRIHSITDLHFGLHQSVSFKDLNHNFVVFYGLNESGKSTIAEYLTWTLGGPWRSFAQGSERFRSLTNDQVSGRLVGTLDGEILDIDARFKILGNGKPNDLRSGTIGKRPIAAKEFSALFTGLTPDDFQWIYRLYGVELGKTKTADDFSVLLSNFTIGDATSTVNYRSQVTKLRAAAKQIGTARDSIEMNISKQKADIKEAEQAPDHLIALRSDLLSIDAACSVLDRGLIELQDKKELTAKALNDSGAIDNQRRFQTELEILGSVPKGWEDIVLQASELRHLRDETDQAEQEFAAAQTKATNSLTRIGLRSDDLLDQTLSATERQQLQSASQEVGTAENNVIQADLTIAQLDQQVSTLTSEINSLAPTVNLNSANFDSVITQAHSFNALQGPAALWLQASQEVADKEISAAAAQAHFAEVSIQKDPDQTATESKMNPALLIGALILVGGLSLINPILSLIGAVGSAIALAVMSKKGVVGKTRSVDQATRFREAQDRMAQVQSDLAAAKTKQDISASRVIEPLSKIGVVNLTADIAQSMITQLINLAGKLVEHQSIYQQLNSAREKGNLAALALITARGLLKDLLDNRRIVNIPTSDTFPAWLTDYEDAVIATREKSVLSEKCSALNSLITVILSPVATQIEGLSWSVINNMLSEYEVLTGKIKIVEQKLRDSSIEVSAAGMDKSEIREILDTYTSVEALQDRLQSLINEMTDVRAERDQHIARRTEINVEIKEKQAKEILPSLLLKMGEFEESLEETTLNHKAHELASAMLGEMLNRFEQNRQEPLRRGAEAFIRQVVPNWGSLMYSRDAAGNVLIERDGTGGKLIDSQLSDGGRSLLYLGIRLAFATDDAKNRVVRLPLICDDPFIHFDDDRTDASIKMFKSIAEQHQVILFTCEKSTRDMARAQGAHIIEI